MISPYNLKGLLIIISGPSGAGKGTVIKSLCGSNSRINILPSVTTRSPRIGEKEGQSYFFRTRDEFMEMIKHNKLIEWVEYCGNFYGTPKEQLESSLEEGFDVILEKEVIGALKIKEAYPESVTIFIAPPSLEELKRRIEGRGTESPDVIERRLDRAVEELEYIKNYDYVVVNENVDETANAIKCIITAEKFKTSRNSDILEKIKFHKAKS
ncbi:MAG TPA: guanylate kinase [Clostridiaceae bacterium]|nr:guanylate kinase [Clostridiaceae bacterium]